MKVRLFILCLLLLLPQIALSQPQSIVPLKQAISTYTEYKEAGLTLLLPDLIKEIEIDLIQYLKTTELFYTKITEKDTLWLPYMLLRHELKTLRQAQSILAREETISIQGKAALFILQIYFEALQEQNSN